MEKSKYSEFDSYTILCDNSKGFKLGYESFLKFREVKKFINQIANKGGDFEVLGNEPVSDNGSGNSNGIELLYQQKLNKNFRLWFRFLIKRSKIFRQLLVSGIKV